MTSYNLLGQPDNEGTAVVMLILQLSQTPTDRLKKALSAMHPAMLLEALAENQYRSAKSIHSQGFVLGDGDREKVREIRKCMGPVTLKKGIEPL